MITISVSGRRATASDLVSLPTGNVQSIKVQFVFPLDDPLWQNALIVAVFAAKTPKGAWIVCPGVIDENKQSTIPGDVLRVADSEIYVGVRATYADNREVTTNVASLGKTVLGAGGEIVDTQIRDSELTQATEFLSDLYDLLQKYTHEHWNMQMLNNLSVSDEEGVLYDGKPIGVKVVLGNLPNAPAFEGKIVYCAYYSLSGFYYSDGTSWIRLTDSSNPSAVRQLLEQKHTHENGSTLDKFTESSGKLLFDGDPIGGIQTVATPNALPANAQNGSVAVALYDGSACVPIEIPAQTAGEEVAVDIAGKNLMIGTPAYNASAIAAAITTQSLPALELSIDSVGTIRGDIMPVVADISNNPYASAGITLDPEGTIVAQGTKMYGIVLDWTDMYDQLSRQEKIVQINETTIKAPISAVCVFEDLTDIEETQLETGWNVFVATIDLSGPGLVDIELETTDDLNEYISLQSSTLNEMTVEGVGGSEIFAGVVSEAATKQKGLYLKLGGEWNRCTLDA